MISRGTRGRLDRASAGGGALRSPLFMQRHAGVPGLPLCIPRIAEASLFESTVDAAKHKEYAFSSRQLKSLMHEADRRGGPQGGASDGKG